MITAKTLKNLKPVLMDTESGVIKTPYYVIEDNGQAIFVISSGQNGVEFNKTEGFFSTFPGMQTYISLYGTGLLLMQRNDEAGEAKEFKVVSLTALKQVSVPAGWGICMINTGSTYLVVLRSNALADEFIDSKPILEKKGLAYFVVEKKGEVSLEPNRNYKVHPQIATE